MPLFPNLEVESTVQVNDRTRLNAGKSFVTQDATAISKVEIDPGTGSFIDLALTADQLLDRSTWYLDYQWDTAGAKACRSRITATTTEIAAKTVTVVTEAIDYLFCTDEDLAVHEPDILRWVRTGRNTFKDIHRACQTEIVDWLDEQGYVDSSGNKYTKDAIVDITEVRQWSKFIALRMIYEGIQNAEDDVFEKKAKLYGGKELHHRNRCILRLDVDGDETCGEGDLGVRDSRQHGAGVKLFHQLPGPDFRNKTSSLQTVTGRTYRVDRRRRAGITASAQLSAISV